MKIKVVPMGKCELCGQDKFAPLSIIDNTGETIITFCRRCSMDVYALLDKLKRERGE